LAERKTSIDRWDEKEYNSICQIEEFFEKLEVFGPQKVPLRV